MKIQENDVELSAFTRFCTGALLCFCALGVLGAAVFAIRWLLSDTSGTGGITPDNVQCAFATGRFALVLYFTLWGAGDMLIGSRGRKEIP